MRRFLSGALPFYALAGLAMCMYLVLYRTNLFDLNAIVQGATGSSWFLVFMFVCVLLESIFPYFGYFPGTALILMSVALSPKSVDVSVFIVAWLAIIVAISGGQSIDGAESPPSFVYGILVTIFLLFNCFAIVQWLQYRGMGRWADYVRGEVAYIVLSFIAKSALAWQIFANTLIPT